jgi:hydrogenase maturation protease
VSVTEGVTAGVPDRAADLVFGYGNPGRGDDALGPTLIERIGAIVDGSSPHGEVGEQVELLTDFQLQPEHALDLRGRRRVLFVDASTTCAEPCELLPLAPAPEASVFTHALAPGALLAVFERIEGRAPPRAWMLAIRGYAFELGEPLSARAEANLETAVDLARDWLAAQDAPRHKER